MSNLQEVLEFIKNSEKSELKSIYDAYAIRMSELKNDIKNTFRIGDIVGIDHNKLGETVYSELSLKDCTLIFLLLIL